MEVGSEFQMGAVLDIKLGLEEEYETMGITILRLWPRVLECGMCCKWGIRVKISCPETREGRVDRSLITCPC